MTGDQPPGEPTTAKALAGELGYQPDSIRSVIGYLATRGVLIDELSISPAQAERIRDTIAGVEYAVRSGCPELH